MQEPMPKQPVPPPLGYENRLVGARLVRSTNSTIISRTHTPPSPWWAPSQLIIDYAYQHGICYPSALLGDAGEALS